MLNFYFVSSCSLLGFSGLGTVHCTQEKGGGSLQVIQFNCILQKPTRVPMWLITLPKFSYHAGYLCLKLFTWDTFFPFCLGLRCVYFRNIWKRGCRVRHKDGGGCGEVDLFPPPYPRVQIMDYKAYLNRKVIRSFSSCFFIILLGLVEGWSHRQTVLGNPPYIRLNLNKCRHYFREAEMANVSKRLIILLSGVYKQ